MRLRNLADEVVTLAKRESDDAHLYRQLPRSTRVNFPEEDLEKKIRLVKG